MPKFEIIFSNIFLINYPLNWYEHRIRSLITLCHFHTNSVFSFHFFCFGFFSSVLIWPLVAAVINCPNFNSFSAIPHLIFPQASIGDTRKYKKNFQFLYVWLSMLLAHTIDNSTENDWSSMSQSQFAWIMSTPKKSQIIVQLFSLRVFVNLFVVLQLFLLISSSWELFYCTALDCNIIFFLLFYVCSIKSKTFFLLSLINLFAFLLHKTIFLFYNLRKKKHKNRSLRRTLLQRQDNTRPITLPVQQLMKDGERIFSFLSFAQHSIRFSPLLCIGSQRIWLEFPDGFNIDLTIIAVS